MIPIATLNEEKIKLNTLIDNKLLELKNFIKNQNCKDISELSYHMNNECEAICQDIKKIIHNNFPLQDINILNGLGQNSSSNQINFLLHCELSRRSNEYYNICSSHLKNSPLSAL